MNHATQLPILLICVPLFSAFLINAGGWFNRRICWPLAVSALAVTLLLALVLLGRVAETGVVTYRLGGWPPPFGIEYVVDRLNGLVLVVIAGVALLAAIFAGASIQRDLPEKAPVFYALFVLLVAGLLGMTATGDAFNLYVLVEIAALTTYALVGIGGGRAFYAGFNYLILGTIGASFYLLGVGHLYIMTGSLNMGDLQGILPAMYDSRAVFVALILILTGIWIKMAFFPLHSWLPNAYAWAPPATGCLVAPLMTKVAVYVMIRLMFSVFSAEYVFGGTALAAGVVWLAVIAILAGSLLALAQTDFIRMLTYLIVAEVGYMVGGVWLATERGLTGAILHIVNDALMTLCLFLVAGTVLFATGCRRIAELRGLYREMPVTMTAFTVGALSMIGVPPTAGFFSKWYLILGAIDAGSYHFMAALLLSSLINAVLFFRVIEIAFFERADAPCGEGDAPLRASTGEAPFSMLAPLVAVAAGLFIVGICAGDLVTGFIQYVVPPGLS